MYNAYITTIKNIRKHSNADRLQCATVFGNNVIMDLSYKDGQRVIYFPVDGQLNEEFAKENNLLRLKDEDGNNIGGYLDPDKRNITALKLRGEKSDGLILPIEVLSKYTDIEQLKEGDLISVINGVEICKKYIPNTQKLHTDNKAIHNKNNRRKRAAKPKPKYLFFAEHSDTSQLAYNQNAFNIGDTCYITLKLHGSSGRTGNMIEVIQRKKNLFQKIFKLEPKERKQYKFISGTRRTVLQNYDGGYYGSNKFREKYHQLFKDKLPKGMEVFYEIVGWINNEKTIMGKCNNKKLNDKEFVKMYGNETTFSYGCQAGENDCYVYRMTMTNEDGYTVEIPWEQVKIECEKLGVKCVPEFEKFTYTTWEDLMERVEKYYDGADPVGRTHIREGVVVRIDNRPKFTAYKHKNFNFKCLEGIVKAQADAPDIEEAEELIKEDE